MLATLWLIALSLLATAIALPKEALAGHHERHLLLVPARSG